MDKEAPAMPPLGGRALSEPSDSRDNIHCRDILLAIASGIAEVNEIARRLEKQNLNLASRIDDMVAGRSEKFEHVPSHNPVQALEKLNTQLSNKHMMKLFCWSQGHDSKFDANSATSLSSSGVSTSGSASVISKHGNSPESSCNPLQDFSPRYLAVGHSQPTKSMPPDAEGSTVPPHTSIAGKRFSVPSIVPSVPEGGPAAEAAGGGETSQPHAATAFHRKTPSAQLLPAKDDNKRQIDFTGVAVDDFEGKRSAGCGSCGEVSIGSHAHGCYVNNSAHSNSEEQIQVRVPSHGSLFSLDPQHGPSNSMACFPQWLLLLYGVLPVRNRLLCRGFKSFPYLLMALYVLQLFHPALQSTESIYLRLTGVCYVAGCLLGLLFLCNSSFIKLLMDLEMYADSFEFMPIWRKKTLRRLWALLILWLCETVVRVAQAHWPPGSDDARWALDCATNIFLSGLITLLIYCHLHVCCALQLMVEKYCTRFFSNPNCNASIVEWNMMSVILRRAAHDMERFFVALHTFLLMAFIPVGAHFIIENNKSMGTVDSLSTLLPTVMRLAMSFLSLYEAALVSEKCTRSPALINSLVYEAEPMSKSIQYVVQFMEHSAAGYYVNGDRLRMYAVMKLLYAAITVLFAVVVNTRQ